MVAIERVQSGAYYPSGAHYPSDVAAIGLAGAWLTRRAPHLVLRHWLQRFVAGALPCAPMLR